MKKKFSKILGVGLAFVLLVSLTLVAAPVSAGTLSWSTVSLPGTTSERLETCNLTDIAVADDGETIYVGGGALLLYKSTDRGVTWSAIATTDNTDLVAVAADDADVMVYASTTDNTVWVSTNGASTLGSIGVPLDSANATAANCTTIRDIAVSADSAGIHYIAVAGVEQGGLANVWYYNIGSASPTWSETNDLPGFMAVSADVALAVEFSPNFPSDQIMVVVTEIDDGGTATDNVTLEMFSFNQSQWNASAGFDSFGVTVATANISGVNAASLALAPDYLGSDDTMRLAYVGLSLIGDTGDDQSGIWRVDGAAVKGLKIGVTYQIGSVDYDGSVLVAGRYDSNICYYSTDPTASTPTVSSTRSLKRPGNSSCNMTMVAWAGDAVVAANSGNSSAFSVSTNNGVSFSDISLIDTSLAVIQDVAVTADESIVYVTTDNTDHGDMSLWRYESSWERVLAIPDNTNFLVRIAPDDPNVIYVADEDATTIYYSADGGQERWQLRTSRYPIQDLAVETDGEVAYVLNGDNDEVSKSSNAGFTWATDVDTTAGGTGYMIKSIGEDSLLVGSTDGYVAYSTDGNSSWTRIGYRVCDTSANVSATASSLADEGYIYAGVASASEDIDRWQIGVSTGWTAIQTTVNATSTAGGLVCGVELQDGVLYVLAAAATANASRVYRTLGPEASPTVYFSTMDSTAGFISAPQALSVSAGKLWAIDTETADPDALYSYTDTLVDTVPTLSSPADGYGVKVNPISGYTNDVTFSWEKPSTGVTSYDLYIYDADGLLVRSLVRSTSSEAVSQVVGREITDYAFTFMEGESYSWKVRVASSGPIYSGFSEVRTFTVAELEIAPPIVIEPAPTPQITVEVPDVIVEMPPTPAAPAPVEAIPPYLLWTIIGIGAVLVIALIILIVRTRRVA